MLWTCVNPAPPVLPVTTRALHPENPASKVTEIIIAPYGAHL
jgi:hypothetical protein